MQFPAIFREKYVLKPKQLLEVTTLICIVKLLSYLIEKNGKIDINN